MQMMNPIEIKFNERHSSFEYTESIDDVTIVFICTSERLINEGFYPERKYVSLKKRYADYRVQLNYSEFINAGQNERSRMCLEAVFCSLKDIGRKVKDFNWEKLYRDIRAIIEE